MKRLFALMVGVVAGIAPVGIGAIGTSGLAHGQSRSIIDERGSEPSPSPAASQTGSDPDPDPDPGPKGSGGDAEAAPAIPPPPEFAGPASAVVRRRRHHRIAVMPRFAYRLGDAGRAVTPAPGFGIGGTIEISYLRWGVGADAGESFAFAAALGLDFSHDRFATSELGAVTNDGMTETFGATRVISETSFVLVHTIAAEMGRVRPYFTLGAGIGLGYFDSAAPDLRPGTAKGAHLLGRASIGVDVKITGVLGLGLRADYTAVRRTSPLETDDGRRLLLFGDLLDMGAGIVYRF
jgi:hypothetical protein